MLITLLFPVFLFFSECAFAEEASNIASSAEVGVIAEEKVTENTPLIEEEKSGKAEDVAVNESTESVKDIGQKVQRLKNEVLELNSDLFVLEEDLLFSANTQISVFVSIDADSLFELDSVQLKLDDKIVSNYLYTKREVSALNRGGIQRLYIGNMTSGEHELTAFFIGKGPSKRNYKRAASKTIEKTGNAKFIELKIIGDKSKEQPEFIVKVWE